MKMPYKICYAVAIVIAGLLAAAPLQAQSSDEVLMTVGDLPVTVGEFTYIYEKNNGDDADYSAASIEEYLDLYTKFKLKVAKAKELRMDTITALKEELDTYQRQLANNYLMDREVKAKLIRQAHDRRQYDVQVAHLLVKAVRVSGKNAEEEALKEIEKIKADLDAGTIDWDTAVKTYSSDQTSAKNGGAIGYLTAMLPPGFEELEQAMYESDKGEIAGPVKTKLGYHLVKVLNKRPARGVVDAAHILLRKPKGGSMVDAKAEAVKAYNDLRAGKSWEQAVTEYSDDPDSKTKAGAIGKVGIGQYAAPFEDALFALSADGAYTKPVETKAGYHIILRKSKEDLSDYDSYRSKMDSRIERLPRYKDSREQLIKDIKAKYGYKVNGPALRHFISTVGDDFYSHKWTTKSVEDVEVFRFQDDVYTMMDFATYLKKNIKSRQRYSKTKSANLAVRELLQKYSDEQAILYEEDNLERTYPDFRNLMREYREGILLFEASKVNVWDKASQDSMGLKRFYENNHSRYRHPAKANITQYIVKSSDGKLLKKIGKNIRKRGTEKVLSKFNKKDPYFVKTVESTATQGDQPISTMDWAVGAVSDPVVMPNEEKATIYKINSIEEGRAKTLSEARGYVIADYQDHLEKVWVAELRSQYPIDLNKSVLESLTK